MSHPRLTLTLSDRSRSREIAVESTRFTIGYAADNDLTIEGPGLARRHALIETFDGIVQVSDCGSESGTFVNGNRVGAGTVLRDGDVLSIGSACHILVSLSPAGSDGCVSTTQTQVERGSVSTTRFNSETEGHSTPAIAIAAAGLILVVAVSLIALLNSGSRRSDRISYSREQQVDTEKNRPRDLDSSETQRDADVSKAITLEAVEKAAAQFMRRISSDDRSYVFPPYAVNALDDVRRRVEQYSSSAWLSTALTSVATAASSIAAQSRREGIEPGLVIYTAFAQTEGGKIGGDPTAASNSVLPDLLSLRKTFGTESADKSLILVAAYKMGGGTKRSHPLLRTMTRVVKNPLTDRNVWYLREHGGLDDRAYEFVVRFLALGVIAENPRRFGVAAQPVAY